MGGKRSFKRYIPVVAGLLLVLCVTGGLIYFVLNLLREPAVAPKRSIQQITLIKPPPPPPPKIQPPPPKVQQEVKVPQPQKAPPKAPPKAANQPPPGKQLGLDANGGAGSDSFGLVGMKGGRSLIDSGGSRFAWYAGVIQQDLQDALSGDEELQARRYSVVVKLWIDPDGRVKRSELVGTTGNSKLDARLRVALSNNVKIQDPPPDGLPQPVKLQISSRL